MTKGALAGDDALDALIAAFIAEAKALRPGQVCGAKDPVANFSDAVATAEQASAERLTEVNDDLVSATMGIVQIREDLAQARGKTEGRLERWRRGRPSNPSDPDAMRVIIKDNPLGDEDFCRAVFEAAIWAKKPRMSVAWVKRRSHLAWRERQTKPKKVTLDIFLQMQPSIMCD